MSGRPKRDRRPARANSKATGPVRAIPAGMAKCFCCGRTLPAEVMQPEMPLEWQRCRECHRKALADERNPWKTPGNF